MTKVLVSWQEVDNMNSGTLMFKIKSIFDEIDEEAEARAIAEAEADVHAARFVSHDKVVKWLRSWGTPDELPCPVPHPDDGGPTRGHRL
jgi:predicted transcriptional regulator